MTEIEVNVKDPTCPRAEFNIDVCGENCPIPLVETRRALRQAKPGDVIVVRGTHTASKEEIPLAVQALGLRLLSVEEQDGVWTICIKR